MSPRSASPGGDVGGEHAMLDDLFERLFPICRSITGPGLRESLAMIAEQLPLELGGVASGTQVFDWTVPDEWTIRAARLTGPDGHVLADLERSSLSVVSFSEAVDRELSLEELRPHLHGVEELPDAIPYVTSYYRRTWGFCLPQRVISALPGGRYHARIDASFEPGELSFGEAVLPGESDEEVLLSSYLCHPSLANNELSGPLTLVALYQRLGRWPRRRYSYRFVLAPETIGSLCYLWRRGDHLRERLVAGLVLTCLGGPQEQLRYKASRAEQTLIDRTMQHVAGRGIVPLRVEPYTPAHGSDERQYCSPGFNLPVGQVARTVYGQYPGYHNSLDTKEFMGIAQLCRSAAELETILAALERAGPYRNLQPHGEPQLGRRGLYPSLNSPATRRASRDGLDDGRALLERMLFLLSYADGQRDTIEIAERCGCSLLELGPAIDALVGEGLLEPLAREELGR